MPPIDGWSCMRNNCLASITDGQIQIQCTRPWAQIVYSYIIKYNVVSEKAPERVVYVLYIKTPPMNI